MNCNYTVCCWPPTSSHIWILLSQFWQIRFESYWLHRNWSLRNVSHVVAGLCKLTLQHTCVLTGFHGSLLHACKWPASMEFKLAYLWQADGKLTISVLVLSILTNMLLGKLAISFSVCTNSKPRVIFQWTHTHRQLRARRALLQFKVVPLRTRMALSP